MNAVNYIILNDSIVLNYSGKTLTLNSTDGRYSKVIEAIKADDLEAIPALVEVERQFSSARTALIDGLIHVDGQPMPNELSNRILRLKENGLPFEPLLKFWDNLKLNPSYNSRQALFQFLEHNGHPLTADGCFIAYRGVSEDLKDMHTGKFDNSPGQICEMERSAVDDNPNNTCSSGLHVACYDYAKGFGKKLVEVKVNPKDVVTVPVDYNGTKMRTCRFEVVQLCEAIRTEELYPEDTFEDDCAQCGEENDQSDHADICSVCLNDNNDSADWND